MLKKVLFMMEACIGDCSRPKYATQCIPMDCGVKYSRGVYHNEVFLAQSNEDVYFAAKAGT